MAKKVINYEDDIFFLNLLLKGLKDGLKLDIDSNFFIQKVKQDIDFLVTVMDQIFKALTENNFMLKRMEYLKSLQRLMKLFIDFLDSVVNRSFPLSEELSSSFDEYRTISMGYDEKIRSIKNILKDMSSEKTEEENIVSSEEFKFLLSGDEDSP